MTKIHNIDHNWTNVIFSLGAGISFGLFLLGMSFGNILLTVAAIVILAGTIEVLI